ncbi:hypothetical protein [Flavobacterium sp.]|jgi:hypothetical protein|uniref:hypothetical protein n=1 Tax=Flavobacterium sp. TaxID=239 RepID=UPI0037BF8EFA
MKHFFLFILLFGVCLTNAQQKILQGNFKNLKGITSYMVTFDYSGMRVEGFDSEEDYLNEKMEKRVHKEGEAEKFKLDWYADRSAKYEPKFIEYLNKRFENGKITFGKDIQAKHTLHVKTTWIYPGYNVVAGTEPAKISAIITIMETDNPTQILLQVEFSKSIGLEVGTFDFDQGDRIAKAYEKLAKNMAMQLKRVL